MHLLHSVNRCWVIDYCLCASITFCQQVLSYRVLPMYIYATFYQHVLSNQVLSVLHSVSCRVTEWTLVSVLHSVNMCWGIKYCLCASVLYSVICRVTGWTLVHASVLHPVNRCWSSSCKAWHMWFHVRFCQQVLNCRVLLVCVCIPLAKRGHPSQFSMGFTSRQVQ